MKKLIYAFTLLASLSLFASEHMQEGHHKIDWNILGGSIFNFFLLLTLLIIFTKRPIKEALKKRKEEMESQINKYKIEKEKAETKLKEYQDKMAKLDGIIKEIKENYEKALKNKEKELQEKNKKDILKLKETYEREIDTRMQTLHRELKQELMDKAVKLSEETIRKRFTENSKSELEFINNFKIS